MDYRLCITELVCREPSISSTTSTLCGEFAAHVWCGELQSHMSVIKAHLSFATRRVRGYKNWKSNYCVDYVTTQSLNQPQKGNSI